MNEEGADEDNLTPAIRQLQLCVIASSTPLWLHVVALMCRQSSAIYGKDATWFQQRSLNSSVLAGNVPPS